LWISEPNALPPPYNNCSGI